MIRLLCWVYQHIDSSALEQLVKSVQPNRQVWGHCFVCLFFQVLLMCYQCINLC